jgi:FtsZ-binding cell division protein ZapB
MEAAARRYTGSEAMRFRAEVYLMSEHAGNAEDVQRSQPESKPKEHAAEPGILTLSATDFSALEERILRAVDVVRRERHARAAAEERAARAEAQLLEKSPQVEQLERELSALRAERDHVRERVERLLGQLDALEL